MNNLLLSLALLFAASPLLPAQSLSTAWFGTVGGGLATLDNGAFSDRLKSYTPSHAGGEHFLYQTDAFATTGYTIDAGAAMLLGESFVIGASGQRLSYAPMETITPPGAPRDEYLLSGGGGGIDLGYAVVNAASAGGSSTLVYPFLQGGYYGYSLQYSNHQSEPIPFFEGKAVPAGTSATYTGAAPRLGIGVGLVHLIGVDGSGSTGGLAIAARVMWGSMLSRPEWNEPDGAKVGNGGLTPAYNGVTFSVSIGGGMGWR
ncbi:MAG: hypothetical protein JWQ98_1907 [Chlorobi bacterium]|nr:hypothetical protein [Chlorobiota bacterium]